MITRPPQFLGLAIGAALILSLVSVIGWSVFQMGSGDLSIWLTLWVLLPLISLPIIILLIYRLYGLLTARYTIDRDGLRLRWGLAYDDIPIHQLARVDRAEVLGLDEFPPLGLWWPGLIVGRRHVEHLGEVEYFSTRGPAGMVIVQTEDRFLAISPQDVDGFLQAVMDSLRLGALNTREGTMTRPTFALARLGSDRKAVLLVVLGGLLPLVLFGYLLLIAAGISEQVAFGFDARGVVDTLAPAGRLLLLPMIGGASWFLNLFFGLWMYRTTANRPLAYVLWVGVILIGGLLWGAALQLLGVY